MSRKYDVMIWGATGFTGQLVAENFARRYMTGKKDVIRLAIAGRNQSKLEKVKLAMKSICPEAKSVDIVIGDANDQSSVDDAVSLARVVIACAGPFLKYGEPVVSACVRMKTDYIDVTGETTFHKAMMDKYGEEAERNGVLLVPSCGFDSLPSDLGALLCVDALRRKNEASAVTDVDGYVKIHGGGASGGTISSIMTTLQLKDTKAASSAFLLNPPGKQPLTKRPHDSDVTFVSRNSELGGWNSFWLMSLPNTRIVRRSAALLEYGEQFSYRERVFQRSLVKAVVTTIAIFVFLFLALFSFTGSILAKFCPQPGQGPSAEARKKAKTHLVYVGKNANKDVVRFDFHLGDVGYTDTAMFLTECAVLTALHKNKLSARKGFRTPASAFGMQMVDRLREAGVKIEQIE